MKSLLSFGILILFLIPSVLSLGVNIPVPLNYSAIVSNLTVNMSSYWGSYLWTDYNMPTILSYAYNQTLGGNGIFVPYTGATANVDLGAFNLTTTGTITGDELYADDGTDSVKMWVEGGNSPTIDFYQGVTKYASFKNYQDDMYFINRVNNNNADIIFRTKSDQARMTIKGSGAIDFAAGNLTTTGTLATGRATITGDATHGLRVNQGADSKGLYVYGYDDVNTNYGHLYVDSGGGTTLYSNSYQYFIGYYQYFDSSTDIYMDLGDALGARELKIRDSGANTVASIDSDGNADFTAGNLSTTGTLGAGATTVTSLDAGSGAITTTGTLDIGGSGSGQAYVTDGTDNVKILDGNFGIEIDTSSSAGTGMYVHDGTNDVYFAYGDYSIDASNGVVALGNAPYTVYLVNDVGYNAAGWFTDGTNIVKLSDGVNAIATIGNVNVTGNITGNQIYGEMFYHNHSATPLDFAVDGTYYGLYMTNASYLNRFTFTKGYTANLTAQVSGLYQANYIASGDGQNNHIYFTSVFINEVNKDNCENHKKMTAGGDIVTMVGSCFIRLSVGDKVSIRTADIGGTGIGNYYSGNLNLVRIGN